MIIYLENIENRLQKHILLFLLLMATLLVTMAILITPYMITNVMIKTNILISLSIEFIWIIALGKLVKYIEIKYNVTLL